MQLAEFMASKNLDDEAMAALVRGDDNEVPCDRSTINRLRNRKTKPSWVMTARIKAVSGGLVAADDWLEQVEAAE